jgi:hypothetical protein
MGPVRPPLTPRAPARHPALRSAYLVNVFDTERAAAALGLEARSLWALLRRHVAAPPGGGAAEGAAEALLSDADKAAGQRADWWGLGPRGWGNGAPRHETRGCVSQHRQALLYGSRRSASPG